MIVIILLGFGGWAAANVLFKSPGGTAKATPSPAPPLTADERGKVADKPVGPTELSVNSLFAENGGITILAVRSLQVSGEVVIGGSLQAASFQGNGSALTGVNAEFLGGQPRSYFEGLVNSVGTLSVNAALRNSANTFTAANVFQAPVTVNGNLSAANLSVAGAASAGSLTLGTALGVGQGGTGLASVPSQGVLYGNGGSALSTATPAGAGLCLVSGVADVQWGSCSTGSVSSVGGTTNALTKYTGAGIIGDSTILDDGSLVTVGGSLVARSTTNSTTAFRVQNASQSDLLRIDTATTPNLVGNPSFEQNTNGWAAKGAAAISRTTSQVLEGQGSLQIAGSAINDGAEFSYNFTPSTQYTLSLYARLGSGTMSTFAIGHRDNGADNNCLSALTVSTSGWTRFSCTFNAGPLISGSNFYVKQTDGAAHTVFIDAVQLEQAGSVSPYQAGVISLGGVINSPTAFRNQADSNVAFQILNAAGSNVLQVDTVTSRLGIGSGVSLSAKLNVAGQNTTVARFNQTGTGDILDLENNGVKVLSVASTGDALLHNSADSAGALRVQNAAGNDVFGVDTAGTAAVLGMAGSVGGKLVFNNGANANTLALQSGNTAGNVVLTLPTDDGGVDDCLLTDGSGVLRFAGCPGASGVTSVNSLSGALTVANASASGSTITIDDASTGTKGIASFNSTNFSVTGGAVNTIQDIDTTATPTFAGLNTDTITPVSSLTLGSTSQSFTLQGNASSTITATGGGFATTVGFTGTPTGAVSYDFDRAATPGNYTICTTAGNCSGGGVSGTGTSGTLAVFTGAGTIGNSLLSQSGGTVTVSGNLNVTSGNQLQINGTQLSSTALSNDSNLAKVDGSQTYTGHPTFRNTANSSSAFQIQNAAGTQLFTVDNTANPAQLITNGSFEQNTSGWAAKGAGASISQITSQQLYGTGAMQINTSTTNGDGAKYNITLIAGTPYVASFYVKATANYGSFQFGYACDGADETGAVCLNTNSANTSVVTNGWTRLSISFTPSSISGTPYFYIKQNSGGTARTFYIDGVELEAGTSTNTIPYKESRMQLNGAITSPLTVQTSNDASSAFLVSGSTGAAILNVDSLNSRVAIGSITAPTKLYVTASGTASARFNQTSANNILELQNNGTTVASVSNVGALTIAASAATYTERLCHNQPDGATSNLTLGDCAAVGQADLAEFYPTEGPVEPGDVVVPSAGGQYTMTRSVSAYQSNVAGVVSTNPIADGIIGHNVTAASRQPIALAGRIPLKVSLENGPIAVGDPLTASSVPGVAMKATGRGAIIGTALEAYTSSSPRVSALVAAEEVDRAKVHAHDLPAYHSNPASWPSGVGKIMLFLRSSYQDPAAEIQGEKMFDNLEVQGKLTVGQLNVGGLASLGSLEVAGTATIARLEVTEVIVKADLTFAGHLISSGGTPSVTSGDACAGSTATINGTDTAGTITIVTGNNCAAAGTLAKLGFSRNFAMPPHVAITPANENASHLQFYRGNITEMGFELITSTRPVNQTTYQYDYLVVQ